MSLQEYINTKYDSDSYWFKEEVQDYWHTKRVMKAIDNKEYLSGKHKIKKRVDEVYNGKTFETRKIGLNYAKTLLSFETAFLLKNDATLISNDIEALETFKKVYREGKYHKLDYQILNSMAKYGEVFEYVYIDENKRVKSKLFNTEDSYPVYNHEGNMIAFINYYIFDGVSHYIVYTNDTVQEYNDKGGEVRLIGEYPNLSGLPITYRISAEDDELTGVASLTEYIDILDNMEDLLSKYMDSFYKFLNPVPVFKGQKLSDVNGGVDPNAVGYALQFTEESDFEYVSAKMDYNSFKTLWTTLKQSLLDTSMTPGVSMNSQEISNISTVSIQMLYGMAEIKGAMNSLYLKEGFEKRWGKMKKLLNMLNYNIKEEAYIDCQFNMNIPQNAKEIIDNLSTLKDINGVSLERLLEVSPYTNDVSVELERLKDVKVVE